MSFRSTHPILPILVLIAIVVVSGCSKTKSTTSEVTDTLRIDGSSTVFPITSKIIEQYNSQFGDLKINLGVSGTGGGFSKFSKGEIDINNASRPITEIEKSNCEKQGTQFDQFKIAIDGIAVVVNPQNTFIDYLTVNELKQIWMNDGAKTWSDVRPEWPNETIELYSPGEASGTYDYFKEVILGSDAYRDGIKMSENDNLLSLGVSNAKNAIGFFALAYFENNKSKLKLVPIDSGNGPIWPTPQTVGSGAYSPLSRPIFIYVNKEFKSKSVGKKFLQFYFNKAASTAQSLGFVPLDVTEYAQSASRLKED